MIYIVSGPSCVGKTTFMAAEIFPLKELPLSSSVFASDKNPSPNTDCVYHYNILRPIHYMEGKQYFLPYRLQKYESILASIFPLRNAYWRRIEQHWSYGIDPSWVHIRQLPIAKKAIILMTDLKTLTQRASKRTLVEKGRGTQGYPSDFWLDLFNKIDLSEVYTRWINELEALDIDYSIIDSTGKEYTELSKNVNIEKFISGECHG